MRMSAAEDNHGDADGEQYRKRYSRSDKDGGKSPLSRRNEAEAVRAAATNTKTHAFVRAFFFHT